MRSVALCVLAFTTLSFVAPLTAEERAASVTHIPDLAAVARTSSDHVMLAEYFAVYAGNYLALADQYAGRAAMYRGHPNRRGGDPAMHWDLLAAHARAAAAEAKTAAALHRRLATIEAINAQR